MPRVTGKTIDDFKDQLKHIALSLEMDTVLFYERVLEKTEKDINVLEGLYQTGSPFSEEFKEAAHRERQRLCQLTSACHSLLRE